MYSPLHRRRLLIAGAGVATSAALTTFEPAAAGQSRTKVFRGRFTDPDGPDWRYLPFRVPEGVREIEVEYTYEPQDLGPISVNVVDIGIFGPSGFRGWSGGARRRFRISREKATPGYLAGPITPGRWRIALGPYQITGAGTPYRVKVTLHFGRPGPRHVPHPPSGAVAGSGPGWYRGDLHVHTVHSDGTRDDPRQGQARVVRDARAAGLDFIGAAEHNTTSGHLSWGRVVPDDFLVIPGEEVTTRAGHWLATGLPVGTWIDWRYRPEDGRLARFTDQVRSLGGLAIAAHPYIPVPSIRWDFGTDFAELDAIEVWNGAWTGVNANANQQAVDRWHALLTAGTFKPAVGNSDSHRHSQPVGTAQTVVRAESLSVTDIVAGYRAGHSYLTESSAVEITEFTATLDDLSGECGDRVPSGEGDAVAVRLALTGVAGCVATLLGPASTTFGTATTANDDGRLVLEATVPGGTAFVRAEVRRGPLGTDPMVAMTNPIFLSHGGLVQKSGLRSSSPTWGTS